MSDDNGNEVEVVSEVKLSISEYIKIGELGLSAFKWFMETTDASINAAAKTLWLSNAGGLVLIIGIALKSGISPFAASVLFIAALAFILGIIWGILPQVQSAHNVASYQVNVALLLNRAQNKEITWQEFIEKLQSDLPSGKESIDVLTTYLLWAKVSLWVGSGFGALGLLLMLVIA